MHASEQNRTDVKAAREVWREDQPALAVSSLVFIDESGVATNMVRRYGRSPIGQRLLAKAPHGHWRTTTFIAALRLDGLGAPMTLDGPMNGETFRAWTEQFLAPVLRRGDIVVMDNLPSHKVSGIREESRRKGPCSSICRPKVPTSIRSSRSSRSSRRP